MYEGKSIAVKIISLHKCYEGISVIENMSLDIENGKIVCIIGPSGCGKSTLLNIISGLSKHSHGEIINNTCGTGFVFQEDRLLPWRNVFENIKLVNDSCRDAVISEVIDRVGLSGFEGYYPSELSGGMRQRVSIARAFVYEADLLLMDEPFKSLDYNLRVDMIRHLLFLWEAAGKTVLFVTHEIDEALLLADKIVVLSKRPATIKKEIIINTPKLERTLVDPFLMKIREDIIRLIQSVDVEEKREMVVENPGLREAL